jgi:hypothetical protein
MVSSKLNAPLSVLLLRYATPAIVMLREDRPPSLSFFFRCVVMRNKKSSKND